MGRVCRLSVFFFRCSYHTKAILTTDHQFPVAIFFMLTISLTTRAQAIGRYNAWAQSISNLQWWSEGGNDYAYGPDSSSYGGGFSPTNRGYPMAQQFPPNAQIIQQQPGHSLLIRPGQNGQPAVVQQVPGTVIGSQAHSFIPSQDA